MLAGKLGEEAIMLQVDSAVQRIGTSAVVPQGCLIAGLEQWVGVSVISKHDAVTDASIVINALDSTEASTSGSHTPVPLALESRQQGFMAKLGSNTGSAFHACKL